MMQASIRAIANITPAARPAYFSRPAATTARIGEIAELRRAGESRGREGHHRDRADDDERDADPQIDPLVADEARRDALVDHIALLEEQLPGRHGGADDGDDQAA